MQDTRPLSSFSDKSTYTDPIICEQIARRNQMNKWIEIRLCDDVALKRFLGHFIRGHSIWADRRYRSSKHRNQQVCDTVLTSFATDIIILLPHISFMYIPPQLNVDWIHSIFVDRHSLLIVAFGMKSINALKTLYRTWQMILETCLCTLVLLLISKVHSKHENRCVVCWLIQDWLTILLIQSLVH